MQPSKTSTRLLRSMPTEVKLYPHQEEALSKLRSGSILCGGVGTGKTLTSLSYYQKTTVNRKLFVITTAKKRNSGDWEKEAGLLGIGDLTVDSWNNLHKYVSCTNAFFIFDEQRVVGYGKWARNFIKIARANPWVLLSATPGDTWMDYIPVFMANNFYRTKTEFINEHVEYDRYAKFPKVKAYHNQNKLFRLREQILVTMPMERHTTRHIHEIDCDYDVDTLKTLVQTRWNVFECKPIETPSEFTQCLRRLVSVSEDRLRKTAFYISTTPKVIIFYNYDYELQMLRELCTTHEELTGTPYAEYNGHKHEDIPASNSWVYLVQYTAGAEGWNCVETDSILFYSPNYSYKIMEQSMGRIDRMNTPFVDLDYIYMRSDSIIDKAVFETVRKKKKFNERVWGESYGKRKRIPRETEERNTDPFAGKYSS